MPPKECWSNSSVTKSSIDPLRGPTFCQWDLGGCLARRCTRSPTENSWCSPPSWSEA
jgi:hypothetical protein